MAGYLVGLCLVFGFLWSVGIGAGAGTGSAVMAHVVGLSSSFGMPIRLQAVTARGKVVFALGLPRALTAAKPAACLIQPERIAFNLIQIEGDPRQASRWECC